MGRQHQLLRDGPLLHATLGRLRRLACGGDPIDPCIELLIFQDDG